jgi:hypothetical protein
MGVRMQAADVTERCTPTTRWALVLRKTRGFDGRWSVEHQHDRLGRIVDRFPDSWMIRRLPECTTMRLSQPAAVD